MNEDYHLNQYLKEEHKHDMKCERIEKIKQDIVEFEVLEDAAVLSDLLDLSPKTTEALLTLYKSVLTHNGAREVKLGRAESLAIAAINAFINEPRVQHWLNEESEKRYRQERMI